ncbi:E3 ubiquitin-protein ligase DZIP3-like [Salvia hispanica]|uniref:E3 ubiquitin-protein ligase DZIP3-like n=1 Tax=Salvia hispanica TaxID=49212 RepID=UPI00200991AB|nr:E3 ubiquitin-protein ligase DZIP3-like [Salvia hispanica]
MDSGKFREGVDVGWPKKQRLNYAGDYSGSSGGSHDLPEDVPEEPIPNLTPPSFARRTRPIGQRRAQRAARGVAQGPGGLVGIPPIGKSAAELAFYARQQTVKQMHKIFYEWKEATDPEEKKFLHSMLESMWVDLDTFAAQLGGSGAGSDAGGAAGGSGDGGEDGGDGDEEQSGAVAREFRQDECIRVLAECTHIFHMACINKWLEHHANCPLCRAIAVHPPFPSASLPPVIDSL